MEAQPNESHSIKTKLTSTPLRVLCVSPLFAPTADSEAFCGAKMVQALMQEGAQVSVLASRNFRDRPLDDSVLWDALKDVTVDVPLPDPSNLRRSILLATRFQTPFHASWVGAAIEKAKLLHDQNKFDVVYTRSIPIAAHMVGFWFAKAFKVPWIANINDPWADQFFPLDDSPKLSFFWSAANMFWLRRTLHTADLVTYPCRRLRDFHHRIAKTDQVAEIIPHIGGKPAASNHTPDGYFRLVHAGKLLAADGRFGKTILLGLKLFLETSPAARAETKLVLVGPGDREMKSVISEMGLEHNVEFVGRVSYEDSLRYVKSASVCVLIEARMEEGIFLASKLSDYLAQGKPVLAISPAVGTAEDLAKSGELIRVNQEPEAVRSAIALLYSEFKAGTLSARSPSKELQAQMQETAIGKKFVKVCETLVAMRADGGKSRSESVARRSALFDQFS